MADLEKVERDMAFLIECFREVLTETGNTDLAALLDRNAAEGTGLKLAHDRPIEQVYSIAFQLLNAAEENAAAQGRRGRESREGLVREEGSWGEVLAELKRVGLSAEEIATALPHIRVEPVLTAHPTEAKRATALRYHRELYLLLVKRENTIWSPFEQRAIRDEVKAMLERLWRTGEIFLYKPDISSERRNIIHYLRNVFPIVLPLLDLRLREAWDDAGLPLEFLREPENLPRLSFGNWVGGDRDGHPFVTAEITPPVCHRGNHPGNSARIAPPCSRPDA
jgi:phosphoenolpyruvate carboxylase